MKYLSGTHVKMQMQNNINSLMKWYYAYVLKIHID